MKTAFALLIALLGLFAAGSAHAQLFVPSYDRPRPFLFCTSIPQGEELSVPFDLINTGNADITIDSAIATGDTSDFYANFLIGSNEKYLNPVMWKFINDRVVARGEALFNNFFFAPKSPGDKQLTIRVYYRQNGSPFTAQATVRFHTAAAPQGLGFLSQVLDTVHYTGSSYSAVTYDRTVVGDLLTRVDTVRLGDTLRAAAVGDRRIDLTSCGGATITEILVEKEDADDIFTIQQPAVGATIASGDSALLDFLYIPRSQETESRSVTVRFITSAGDTATFQQTVITPRQSSGVEEAPRVTGVDRATLECLPNPFMGAALLRVNPDRPVHARLSVLNTLGEEVALLLDERVEAGSRELTFDATGLPAGVYFARVDLGGEVSIRRMVVAR